MASASKTPNLNLPQWVGTEKPERTDFNAAFDAIDDEIASHLADYALMPEIISNSNGTAFKFPSGLMICIQYLPQTDASVNANGYININYTTPQPFISTPSVSGGGLASTSTGFPVSAGLSWQGYSQDTIRCTVVSHGQAVEQIRRLSYIAIGRWK